MFLDAIPPTANPPDEINVIIEIPAGEGLVKYEISKDAGILAVDRFLDTPTRYPGNYGFIPQTLSGDGDPCDVLVACAPPILPGALVRSRVAGVLIMRDDSGPDEKIIAVPSAGLSQSCRQLRNYTDLPDVLLRQIEHFFSHYKDLDPRKWARIERWGDSEEARQIVARAIERAKGEKR